MMSPWQATKYGAVRTREGKVKKLGAAKKPVSLATFSRAQTTEMLNALGQADKKLKALMAKVDGGFTLKIKEAHSPFEAITEAIIYQQLTGKAASTILGRFKALFGESPFPTPKQIIEAPETVLRSAGLSRAKIVAIKDLADKTLAGKIPTIEEVDKLTDEEIVKALTAVKGVGTWTAHMFLIFRLGRPDVMPSGDYGVRKGFAIIYGDGVILPTPTELETFAETWRPFRSVASWYMWRAIEVHRATYVPVNKTITKKVFARNSTADKPNAKRAKPTSAKPTTKETKIEKQLAKKSVSKKTSSK
jgi:DNA-3-methyladenine glycosylase II